jgi:sec-independent protein translocase protein TatB
MFDIGFQEMVVIGVLALLVFGPSKLPELGRRVGRLLREFRRASDEFRSTVETNLKFNEPDPPPPASQPAAAAPAASSGPSPEPAAAAPASEDAVAVEHGEPFTAQRGSRLVHRRECAWVPRIPEVERVYWKRLADARDEGFSNCPVCEPWEPA